MQYRFYKISIILILALTFGCKSLDTTVNVKTATLPTEYNHVSDTLSVKDVSWRTYFKDSLLCALIDTVLYNNPDLHMSYQRLEMARTHVMAAKSDLFPRVGLNTNGGMRRYGLYTMDGAGNISTEILPGKIVPIDLPDYYVGIQASWEADMWGKLRNKKRMAQANYLSSVEGVNLVVTSLIADIAVAYYELVALDHELTIIQQTIQQQQHAIDVVEAKKEAGKSNQLAVQQFQAYLLNSKALEKYTLQKIVETENYINLLAGRFPQGIVRTSEFFANNVSVGALKGIPSQLLTNRPDIRAAALGVEAEKFNLKSVKAEFLPSFNITSGLGFQAFQLDYLFQSPASLAYSAIGSLTAPLINRKSLHAKFKNAKASQINAIHHYQKTILNGYAEVVTELSNLEKLQQIDSLKETQSTLLLQSIETANALFESNKATYLEVLLTQQNALQANLELIEARKRLSLSTIKLYKVLGGGWQ